MHEILQATGNTLRWLVTGVTTAHRESSFLRISHPKDHSGKPGEREHHGGIGLETDHIPGFTPNEGFDRCTGEDCLHLEVGD